MTNLIITINNKNIKRLKISFISIQFYFLTYNDIFSRNLIAYTNYNQCFMWFN